MQVLREWVVTEEKLDRNGGMKVKSAGTGGDGCSVISVLVGVSSMTASNA